MSGSVIITIIYAFCGGVEYSMLDINKKEFYNKFKVAEPKQIVEEIQQKEDEDNKCNKYPRFKKSDDKSLLLIEF